MLNPETFRLFEDYESDLLLAIRREALQIAKANQKQPPGGDRIGLGRNQQRLTQGPGEQVLLAERGQQPTQLLVNLGERTLK